MKKTIRRSVQKAATVRATNENTAGQIKRLLKWALFGKRVPELREHARRRAELVNKLTNWQRNQWARAGYPERLEDLKKFAELTRHAGA